MGSSLYGTIKLNVFQEMFIYRWVFIADRIEIARGIENDLNWN